MPLAAWSEKGTVEERPQVSLNSKPVKHLSDFAIKTDACLKGKNVTRIHASSVF